MHPFVWLIVYVLYAIRAVARWLGLPGTGDPHAGRPRVGAMLGAFRTACVAVIVTGIVMVLPRDAPSAHAAQQPAAPSLPALTLPGIGETFDVDISATSHVLRDFGSREVADQLRDWAVLGTLNRLNLSADTLARATVGMVPARFPYLEEMFPFEYGRGRRAIVETGTDARVLLFYEAKEPDPAATLGRLADRVRMELGETPREADVFEIDSDLPSGVIHVTRRPSLSSAQLFGPEYGYQHAKVESLDDFKSWLASVDDVTWASTASGALELGGRRLTKTRERTVSLEDVVVLYRAQVGAKAEEAEVDEDLKTLAREIESEYPAPSQRDQAQEAFDERAAEMLERNGGNLEPGFSLDPQWQLKTLIPALDVLSANVCNGLRHLAAKPRGAQWDDGVSAHASASSMSVFLNELRKGPSYGPTCDALHETYAPVFRDVLSKLIEARREPQLSAARRVAAATAPLYTLDGDPFSLGKHITTFLKHTQKVQCARYDGPHDAARSLQFTRVGMNLFYTDLLAKLWSADHWRSAPSLTIAGFLTHPRMDVEPAWLEETERLASTRLWFGPKREASARSESGRSIAFRHIGTRVFAAGSHDGSGSQKEEQPNEASRRIFGWWDRHYEEIAVVEPEYALQNQIMKWSTLTEWLADTKQAHFLDDATLVGARKLRFNTWYEDEKTALGLRFNRALPMIPSDQWPSGTECLPLLMSPEFASYGTSGWTVSGGVSLAGKAAAKAAPRVALSESAALRYTRALASEGPAGVGTSIKVTPRYQGAGRIVAKGSDASRVRWAGHDLQVGKTFGTRVLPRHDGSLTELHATADKPLMWFKAQRRGDGVAISLDESTLHAEARAAALGKPAGGADAKIDFHDPRLLSKLDAAAGGDIDKAVRMFEQTRAKAIGDAKEALASGDIAGAAARLRAGNATTPELALQRALLEVERGTIARGKNAFASMDALPFLELDAPVARNLKAMGLSSSDTAQVLKGGSAAHPYGRVSLHPEPGRSVVMLTLERPMTGQLVPLKARPGFMEKLVSELPEEHDFRVYIADEFSLNQQDLATMGDGALADFARMPEVKWERIAVDQLDYAPERLVVDGVAFQMVQAPRRARVAQAGGVVRNVILVRPSQNKPDCDPQLRADCPR